MKQILSISIIAPNFNNGAYLDSFIQSVVNSEVHPLELIIVDDGSTDISGEILRNYTSLRFLNIIRFGYNRGLPAALNEGISVAKGDYIMRADPDDILLPDRMGKQYQFMEQHPEVDVLGSNVKYFHSLTGKYINASNFPLTHSEIYKRYMKGEHGIQHPTAIIRSRVFKKYRYQSVFPGEDYELFSRMIADGKVFANLKEPLYLMRVHSGSSTSNLRYESIKKTFDFRDRIFGTKSNSLLVYRYFLHICCYRKYQITENSVKKYFFLLVSTFFYPQKLIRRATGLLSFKRAKH